MLEKLKKQISDINVNDIDIYSEGIITQYGDGIAFATGLKSVGFSEIVRIFEYDSDEKYALGMVFNLESENIGLILLEDNQNIKQGSKVISTGEVFQIESSESYLGRTIDIFGRAIDGRGEILHKESKLQKVERKAYGVMARQSVTTPLQTGITAIDALIPIGRGQRELIIGDRQTGKTSLALDIIINQGKINQRIDENETNEKKVYSIYVAIGQKQSKIAQLERKLHELGVAKYCVIVSASAADPASAQFLAPYIGTAIGEYFMERGDDALIVYDDLSKHAKAYRQLSLLLRRPPGREAYPGDIFYLHSRLLERSAQLNESFKGGSLTSLPIIETLAGDISAYIPTNVISITDGQIYLKSELFNSGVKPAIDVGNSVSRVGGNAQIKAMKQVAGPLKLNLAQFRELQTFIQFGVEVDAETQKRIDLGLRLSEVLKQEQYSGLPVEEQIIYLWAVTRGYANGIELNKVLKWAQDLLAFFRDFKGDVLNEIVTEKKISEELDTKIKTAVEEFINKEY